MIELVGAAFRALLMAAMGGLVTKGWLTAEDLQGIVTAVTGALGVLGLAVYAVLRNRLTATLERVAAAPEVKVVVAEPEVAQAVESPKVVPDDGMADLQ